MHAQKRLFHLERCLIVRVILLIVSLSTLTAYILIQHHATVIEQKRQGARCLVERTINLLNYYHTKADKDALSKTQAMSYAISTISVLATGKNEYLWVMDETPTMIMHPQQTELSSKNLLDFTIKGGQKPFQEMTTIIQSEGEGFISYTWPLPNQNKKKYVKKVSYIKKFEPWGWIIGTGIYLDDINAAFTHTCLVACSLTIAAALIIVALSYIICGEKTKKSKGNLLRGKPLH
jgi:methyl-accepting chemotaxis protein